MEDVIYFQEHFRMKKANKPASQLTNKTKTKKKSQLNAPPQQVSFTSNLAARLPKPVNN